MKNTDVYDCYFQKMIEEKNSNKLRTKKVSQIIEEGEQYITKIQKYITLARGKSISKKIIVMKNTVSMIFLGIDMNQNLAQSLCLFLNYYLSTTENLLEAYFSPNENRVSKDDLYQAKKEIEEAIDNVAIAFDDVLKKLYEAHKADIANDITTVESAMKQGELLT